MKFSEFPYERVDIEKAKAFFADLIEKAKAAKSGEELFELHKTKYAYMGDVWTNAKIATFRHSVDTTDEFYTKENDFYDEITPILLDLNSKYEKVLFESPFRSYMEEKIGKVAFKNIELHLKSMDEKILPLMQEENALISKYDALIASAKIPFHGEEYNISLLRKFLTSEDREVRKEAWKALSTYFQSVTADIDDIYDKLDRRLGAKRFDSLFPVIVTDNGSEFSNPKKIEYREFGSFGSRYLRTRVFYCDAGCPYQKGAIEVNHELIRRVLPKGTSFDNLTQADVTRMMDHINSYKRKKLNDRSPYETFSFHYGEEVLKLLGCTPVASEDILLKPSLLK